MIINKKGVSDVVITVSLILLSIVAVGVISSFVVPMIKKQLAKSAACIDLRMHYKVVVESSGTCTNSTTTKLVISRGTEKGESKGFLVSIYTTTGTATPYKETSNIPTMGGANSYIYNVGPAEKISIATILPNDDVCDATDYTGLSTC